MKRLLTGALALILSIAASATTLNPVQLLNPAGSSSGQAVVSTGASSAPTFGSVTAPNVTYTQGATGSLTRSVTSKFQDSISTADFSGCDPTGTTDSTTCLQNAITAAANKNLYIAPGNYKYTALTLSNPIAIIGGGPGSVTLTQTTATGDGLTVSGTQVLLQGMSFTSSVTRTAGAFINFTSSSNRVTLRDFYMTNYFVGVHMTAASAGRVQFGYMFGPATAPGAGSAGILIDGGNDQYINQVTMDAPAAQQPAAGIQVTNTGALNLTDDDIIHHGSDLLINPGNGQTVASLWAENSYFDTATNGIVFSPTGTGNVIRSRFVGTWTSSHTGTGIVFNAPGTGTFDGIEFIGHHAFGNTSNAVNLSGGTNIRFLGGAYAGSTAGSGFSIGAGVSGWSIEGAKIGSGFGFGGNTFGIFIAVGASNNWSLIGNDMRGNSSSALSDGSTGTTKFIFNNLGLVTTSGAINGATIDNAAIGATTPSTGSFTTLAASGLITPTSTIGIKGTTTNDNAQAGSVGEYQSNTTSGTSLTTGTPANCTSISLTAGDWDVWGMVLFIPAGGTTITGITGGVNTVSATLPGGMAQTSINATLTTGAGQGLPVTMVRESLSATTTVFLVGQGLFGASTMTCTGYIAARRIR